jgi:serine/threonine protein kinase/Flp pilus assembly protein TadD
LLEDFGKPMSDLAGRRLGKYEVRERLGRGGMADVYKAYQPGMNRFVAIKVMHGHLSESPDFIERFKREAQSVGQLRHPHILNVIDFDAEDDLYYMVMEFIKGDTLKSYMAEEGMLPPYEAIRIAAQIADALDYAHQNGMIHRDIKPANIMFTQPDRRQAVLTDFGIARLMDASGLTMSGAAVGTPAYMSPESGKGERVDERSDIYSMGVVIYEMLTGTIPFSADTPYAVILKHIQEPLPDPRHYQASLSDPLEALIFKALAKLPAERYQTAGELRQALLEAQTETATNITPAPRPTKVFEENGPTLLVDSATPARVTATKPTKPRAKESLPTIPATPSAQMPRQRRWLWVMAALVGLILVVGVGILWDESQADEEATTPIAATEEVAIPATEEAAIASATEEPPNVPIVADATGTAASGLIGAAETPNVSVTVEVALAEAEGCLAEGQILLDQGDLEGAIQAFSCVLEADPTNIEALSLRASTYSYFDGAAALADLNRALQLRPDDALLLSRRAGLLASTGDFVGALSDYNAAIVTGQADPYTYAGRGRVYEGLGDYEAALADYTSAIQQSNPVPAEFYLNRANLNWTWGNSEMARVDFELAMQAGAEDAWTYFGYAAVLKSQGEVDGALEYFSDAITEAPDFGQAYFERGLIYFDRGFYYLALKDFNQAAKNEPFDLAMVYNARGLSYMYLGKLDKALPEYDQAIELAEGDTLWIAQQNRGDLYLGWGDYEQARADFDLSEENGNPNAYLYQQRAVAALNLEDYQAALEDINRSLELYNDNGEESGYAYAVQGDIYYSLGEDSAAVESYSQALNLNYSTPQLYLRRGESYFHLDDFGAAVQDFDQAIALDEAYWEAYQKRGESHIRLEEYQAAIDNFNLLVENGVAEQRTYQERGLAYLQAGDLDAAQSDFETARDLDSNQPYPFYLLGLLMVARGDDEAALGFFQTAQGMGAIDPDLFYATADIYRRREDWEGALGQYQRLLELYPEDAWVHRNVGEIYLFSGQFDIALGELRTSINLGLTDDAYTYALIGDALTNLQDYAAAIEAYSQALGLDPTFTYLYQNRAFAYLQLEDYATALADTESAIAADSANAAVYDLRGLLFIRLGQLDQAQLALREAISLDPRYPSAYLNLASLYEIEGNTEQAIRNYEVYLQIMEQRSEDPDPDALERLSALREQ